MLTGNILGYFTAFRCLTLRSIATRPLVPGAFFGAVDFTVLITVGSWLIQHQLRHSSTTYGQFGAIIGLVGFLLLLANFSMYGAELNVVLSRHVWPRALVSANPTQADDEVFRTQTYQTKRRMDQIISVEFEKETPPVSAS
jgi:uncharacterized BrkB/YihY/UPF0761 family membrane protein